VNIRRRGRPPGGIRSFRSFASVFADEFPTGGGGGEAGGSWAGATVSRDSILAADGAGSGEGVERIPPTDSEPASLPRRLSSGRTGSDGGPASWQQNRLEWIDPRRLARPTQRELVVTGLLRRFHGCVDNWPFETAKAVFPRSAKGQRSESELNQRLYLRPQKTGRAVI